MNPTTLLAMADTVATANATQNTLTYPVLLGCDSRVVRHAPCPVLVVREKEREFIHR